MKNTACVAISAASISIAATALLMAGPLDPPAGAVAPTYKTLSEVEPRTPISLTTTPGDSSSVYLISQPGSYYLTSNLTGAAGKSVIKITSDNVTLDLGGFTITGGVGPNGIAASGALSNITVRNGVVRSCILNGINLTGGSSGRVESVIVENCNDGIAVGEGFVLRDCAARNCNHHGFILGAQCTIQSCLARDNDGDGVNAGGEHVIAVDCTSETNGVAGFRLGASGQLRGCTAGRNTGSGIVVASRSSVLACVSSFNTDDGISTSIECTVADCTVNSNTDIGIIIGGSGSVQRCTVNDNDDSGIDAGIGCSIAACNVGSNGVSGVGPGIRALTNCTITGCTVVSNAAAGITAGTSATVSDCSAVSNNGDGIFVGQSSLVQRCSVTISDFDGIEVSSDSRVIDNHCRGNGSGTTVGAGILVTGTDNRIDGNNVGDNDTGILVQGAGNILTGNTAAGNTTNYSLVVDNVCLVVNATLAPAFSGSSGGLSPGSTNPWVNFSY